MRTPPKKISIPSSATAIEEEIGKLLRAADVGDRLPTPKSDILGCTRLIEIGELDLSDFELGLRQKALGLLRSGIGKVLGFLDRRSEVVYVASNIPQESRRLFVTYHEVVHNVLPWQQVPFAIDDMRTISPECEDVFEAEANFGAAEILFQGRRFERESRDYSLSIPSALTLGEKYDASWHSALRRFVERNHRPCVLLVLCQTDKQYSDHRRSYFLRYAIPSAAFVLEFGEVFDEKFINPGTELGRILNGGGGGNITVSNVRGFAIDCQVEVHTNSYSTFALVFPVKAGRRSKISARFLGTDDETLRTGT